MYQLLLLSGPPRPRVVNVSDICPSILGNTYGAELRNANEYSVFLREVIWHCLAEVPRDRISFRELHLKVDYGSAAATASGALNEGIVDILNDTPDLRPGCEYPWNSRHPSVLHISRCFTCSRSRFSRRYNARQ